MSSRATKPPRGVEVFNTTPGPLIVDDEGHTIDGYSTATVPSLTVPRVAAHVADGRLYVPVADAPEAVADTTANEEG